MNTDQDEILPLSLLNERLDAELRKKGFRSYDDWQKENRAVVIGSKATRWSPTGIALFHRNQTTEIREYNEALDESEYDDDNWGHEHMGFDIMDFGCRD